MDNEIASDWESSDLIETEPDSVCLTHFPHIYYNLLISLYYYFVSTIYNLRYLECPAR